MHNAHLVDVRHALQNLAEGLGGGRLAILARVDEAVEQLTASDELHDDRHGRGRVEHLVDLAHVWVVALRVQVDLVLDVLKFVARLVLRDDLDCHHMTRVGLEPTTPNDGKSTSAHFFIKMVLFSN